MLLVDEVGYLTYGTDAANMLFHVVNDRHRHRRAMLFATNKPLSQWGRVLHDDDLAHAIVDRVLERARLSRSTDRHTERSTSALTTRPLRTHLLRWPDVPEFARRNFRNPQTMVTTHLC